MNLTEGKNVTDDARTTNNISNGDYFSSTNPTLFANFSTSGIFTINHTWNESQPNDTSSYGLEDYDNYEVCLERGTGSVEDWTFQTVVLLIQVMILLCNSFIVVAILRQWTKEGRPIGSRAASCYLVLNLASADALVGLFQIFQFFHFFVCVFYEAMSRNVFTCLLPGILTQFVDCASAFTVIAIALDRVLSVTKAVLYRNILSQRRALFAIGAIWCLSLFVSLTVFMIPGAYLFENGNCEYNRMYDDVLFWGTIILIYGVLIFSYWIIHKKTLEVLRRGSTGSTRNLVGTKAARMLLIIIAWDSCAYCPLIIVTLLEICGVQVSLFLTAVVKHITSLTFLADPFIYANGNPHTKRAISNLLMCLRGHPPSEMDIPGNRESLGETSTNMVRRMMSSLTNSSVVSDRDKSSPNVRRHSFRLE